MKKEVAALQSQVPDSVKKKKIWKRKPKDASAYLVESVAEDDVVDEMLEPVVARGEITSWWQRTELFNPHGSAHDTKNLARHLKLKLPIKRGGTKGVEEDETAQAKHLKVWGRKYPIFLSIIRAREKAKLVSTYIWPTSKDNRVHCTIGWQPKTWRKSTRDPSTQNWPKRDPELAPRLRRTVIATPGHSFVTADSSAIEAVLTGWFAGSPRLITLAQAGIHDWVAAAKLGTPIPLDISFEELSRRCKEIKKLHKPLREKMKRVVYLSTFGGTPNRILEEYPDDFKSLKDAKELQEFYFSTEAGQDIKKWHRQVLEEASYNTYLENPWKYRQYFFDVYNWLDYRGHKQSA